MAKSKRKSSFWLKVLLGINFIAVVALLLAYISFYVSPAKFWLPAFAGLAYPYIIAVNLFFILVWVLIRWKFALFSFVAIVAGYGYLSVSWQYHAKVAVKDGDGYFKVLSYNVRNFDLYNYKKNWEPNFEKRNSIFKFIQKEGADIMCFQEFVNDLSGRFKTMDTITTFQKARNVHAEFTVTSRNMNQFGIATFTSFPIVNKGRIDFPNAKTNLCIFTDILVGKDTLRVYNAHFESIHFNYSDYEFTEKLMLTPANNEPDLKNKSMRILRLMKRAFLKRAMQVDIVANHIKTSPYPVIFCTDLNDTPISYAYHQLTRNLHDAFTESGSGYGHTYTEIFPSFRIDYVFLSKTLASANFTSMVSTNSDHYAIECLVRKKSN
ncbi:MAG: endonuclease/exonuclease/phosphatase family protein [Bacteroidota bacterium]